MGNGGTAILANNYLSLVFFFSLSFGVNLYLKFYLTGLVYFPGSRPRSYRRRQCSRNSGPKIGSMNNLGKLDVKCTAFPSVVVLITVFWDSFISDLPYLHLSLSVKTRDQLNAGSLMPSLFGDLPGLENTAIYQSAGAKSTFGGSIV